MASYYLYFEGPTGRFAARETIQAPDDAAAIVAAERRRDERKMELWQGPRRVRAFPGRG